MGIKDLFSFQKNARTVQTAREQNHPYSGLGEFVNLSSPDHGLYSAMREAVPIIDAALDKIVRLTGGFQVECTDSRRQGELDRFIEMVAVGSGSVGLHQFVAVYLDCLLTFGNAVGEIVLAADGSDIHSLYNASLADVRVRRGSSPLDVSICGTRDGIRFAPVAYPELVLFTPLNPPPGEILGQSLLRSLPFVTSILLKIYGSIGVNFQRIASLRYAVTYKPGSSGLDRAHAKDIADTIAREWGDAMSGSAAGTVKDFVAVGDVDIKVIGADNQMIDTEVPVRQMLEQIVAKLGVPPFMLGLHWSTTERMSAQQADILTSELESYRGLLNGVILRICRLWLKLRGYGCDVRVIWDDINLQDEVEAANARYLNAQARELEQETGGEPDEAIGH